ncbi:MAG: heme ABC transporter ATP-binding protein [Acidimicrobiia bacterium]|nr:heme ABC transporter ATP-binding protein [Acidimicrobiia bacterium]
MKHDAVPERLCPGEVVAEARDVTVRLGGREVVSEADITVRAGEVVALVGPNGAGKSTLLGVVAGDIRASAGAVAVCGRDPRSWGSVELARRRSVLAQRVDIAFPFTVSEVVAMGRSPWERTAAAALDDEVIATAMRTTGTWHLRRRRFPELSGGERARVALAKVLAQATQLAMLDEPTAALDLRHQEHVLGVARSRAGEGDAVLIVLHDLGLAAAYADRVALMHAGRVAAQGSPADVLRADLLAGVYGHPVEVIAHPRTGVPLVLPMRHLA